MLRFIGSKMGTLKTVIAQHDTVLGVTEQVARAFSKKWYCSKRQETAAIWKQRKSRTGKKNEISLQELQEKVKDIWSGNAP